MIELLDPPTGNFKSLLIKIGVFCLHVKLNSAEASYSCGKVGQIHNVSKHGEVCSFI